MAKAKYNSFLKSIIVLSAICIAKILNPPNLSLKKIKFPHFSILKMHFKFKFNSNHVYRLLNLLFLFVFGINAGAFGFITNFFPGVGDVSKNVSDSKSR